MELRNRAGNLRDSTLLSAERAWLDARIEAEEARFRMFKEHISLRQALGISIRNDPHEEEPNANNP
jgi:outer membrane protein TolC